MSRLNKSKSVCFVITSIIIAIIFCCNFFNLNNSSVVSASLEAQKEITNNLILFKFKDDTVDYIDDTSLYTGDMTDFYNEIWNGETNSVKKYFCDVSNNLLTFDTYFLTENNGDIDYLELDFNRGFFSPYLALNNNNQIILNTEGYFEYELIDITDRPSSNPTYSALLSLGTDHVDYLYLDTDKHISNVYDCSKYTPTIHDYNHSDGICCKCHAQNLVVSNDNYDLIESVELDYKRIFLAFHIYESVKEKLGSNLDILNSDGFIDCVSMIANGSSYIKDDWAQILWPHSSDLSSIYSLKTILKYYPIDFSERFQSIGDSVAQADKINDVINRNVNTTDEIKLGNYIMLQTEYPLNMTTESIYNKYKELYGTYAHELSHLLGLPDYYRYDNNSAEPVGKWSLMCYNSDSIPQYLLSYDRETLGFLNDTTNILDITENGYYELEPVTISDKNKTVAYKVGSSKYSNQSIYLEYRNGEKNYYDEFLDESGLLVYRVDTNQDGNYYPGPNNLYEVYVIRKDGQKADEAALTTGESLSNELVYTNGSSWGLEIKVIEKNDSKIKFEVISNDLQDREITLNDLGNNQSLYEKLLSLAISLGDSKIYYNSFKDLEYIDLSSCNLFNFDFLKLFDLSNLKTLNLNSNNITNSALSTFCENYPSLMISVIDNKINLKTLSDEIKNNNKVLLGIQNLDKYIAVNASISVDCYWRAEYNNYFTLKVNNKNITSSENITLSTTGENSILISDKLGLGISLEKRFTIISVKQKENIVFYLTDVPSDDWSDYIEISGISTNSLQFEISEIDLEKDSGEFSITIKKDSSILYTQQVAYNVISKVITKSDFADENLYNKLNEMSSFNLNQRSFYGLSYIDLSSSNISSLTGLEHFIFTKDAIINLSSNNLYDLNELNTILNEDNFKNVKLVILIDNDFTITNNSNTKLIFGIQLLNENLHYIDTDTISANLDYNVVNENLTNYFNLSTNDLSSKNYGTIYYTYNGKNQLSGKKIEIKFIYAKVWLQNKTLNIQAGNKFSPSTLKVTGINLSNYTIENDTVDTSILSTSTINYYLKKDNTILKTLSQTVSVVDTLAPIITLNGDTDVYIKVGDSYLDDGASAIDSFEGQIQVSKKYYYKQSLQEDYSICFNVDTALTGYYKIEYIATDSSNNSISKFRFITIGNVTVDTIAQQDINVAFNVNINFVVFDRDMYNITYSLNNGIFKQWTGSILSKHFGNNTLLISLNSSIENINYTFNLSFNVSDNERPTLLVNGYLTQYFHMGDVYVELGVKATDNSTNEQLLSQTGFGQTGDGCLTLSQTIYYLNDTGDRVYVTQIPSNLIRTYYINYVVKDSANNSDEETRVIHYIYPEVKNLYLDYTAFKVKDNEEFTLTADVVLEIPNLSDDSIIFEWYVDGKIVEGLNSKTANFNITEKGEHEIAVKVVNRSNGGGSYLVSSNKVEVVVIKENFISKYGLYIFIALGIAVIFFIVILIKSKSRRNKWY